MVFWCRGKFRRLVASCNAAFTVPRYLLRCRKEERPHHNHCIKVTLSGTVRQQYGAWQFVVCSVYQSQCCVPKMTVQQEPPNPFRKPPDQSEFERMRVFLYNHEEGTVCSRGCKSWGKIFWKLCAAFFCFSFSYKDTGDAFVQISRYFSIQTTKYNEFMFVLYFIKFLHF